MGAERGVVMRLIDADALKEFIDNGRVCDICSDKKLNCAIHCDFPDTLTPLWEKVIDNAPTICERYRSFCMVKPERPQGEWLDEQFVAFHLTCNKCGCNIRRQKDIVFEGEYNYNFCPNCGAYMRGGKEND